MKTKFILVLVAFSWLSSLSQNRSKYEWLWALGHPFAAVKVKMITKKCYFIYNNDPNLKNQLDHFSNGGKLDAFRHVFFMAAFAQKIKVKKLRKLGIAHEKGNYRQFLRSQNEDGEIPDSLETVMDLKNNEVGFEIGKENKKAALENLKDIVVSEIKKGKAMIMKRNNKGIYLDCSNKPIDLWMFRTWSTPKCLVSSDNDYKE